MLSNRHIAPLFKDGVEEVHLVFDKKCTEKFNPKHSEQVRRDKDGNQDQGHVHIELTPQCPTPHPWSIHLKCRECKYAITEAVGLAFMQIGRSIVKDTNKLILSGCFGSGSAPDSAWVVSTESLVPQPEPMYTSNASEADGRIWRHVEKTTKSEILIFSPDTDIYNIGMTHTELMGDKNITVQVNVIGKAKKYISLGALAQCLARDPDLAMIPPEEREAVFQTIFLSSGCDYISYFSGHGKATFLNVFCQNAAFISGSEMTGSLSQTTKDKHMGFLAFLRLIGSLYFKKYWAAIVTVHDCETPQQLFQLASDTMDDVEKHNWWIEVIRKVVSERIVSEEDRLPSTGALRRHWARTCWISQYWYNSTNHDTREGLPQPEQSGWLLQADGTYTFDWDSPELQERVKNTVEFLTKGCSCSKTHCRNCQCSCRKQGRHCGPACKCRQCENIDRHNEDVKQSKTDNNEIEADNVQGEDDNDDYSEDDDYSDDDDSDDDEITTEFIPMDNDDDYYDHGEL